MYPFMNFRRIRAITFIVIITWMCAQLFFRTGSSTVRAQQPTGSVPTVTGTPAGVIVAVYLDQAQINVYSGPSSYLYPAVGVLLAGQEVPAFGISEDRNYIQIYYAGVPDSLAWVYAPLVRMVKTGNLPVLRAPPTPTPVSTPTLNPTLEAAFIAPVTPTRLPTFTQPAPLVLSSFEEQNANTGQIPIGLLIFGFGFLGALGVLISFLQGQ